MTPKTKQARDEIKQLQTIRERVTDLIEERREVLRESVERETQLSPALNGALAVELDLHVKEEQGIAQPTNRTATGDLERRCQEGGPEISWLDRLHFIGSAKNIKDGGF